MIIREMNAGDIPSLAALYTHFWGERSNAEKMRETFAAVQKNDAYILLCAFLGDALAGSVMGIVCEDLYGECQPFLLLENMVVDSACRRKGVGKALYGALEDRARQRGCAQIILVTETDREDACAFYPSLGFHPAANRGFKKKLG